MAPKCVQKYKSPAQRENPRNGFREIYLSLQHSPAAVQHSVYFFSQGEQITFLTEHHPKVKSEIKNLLLPSALS
jgi:hypothetical protein